MTRLSEPAYSLELPGTWEPVESEDPGALVYRETDGPGLLTLMLLRVRPMFSIADRARLLSDYTSHRQKYERAHAVALEQSDPVFQHHDEFFEASWRGWDPAADRQHQHRAILVDDLLADFCFESSLSDNDSFEELAQSVLSTATVSPLHEDESS